MAKQDTQHTSLGSELEAAKNALREQRETWDEKERLLLGRRTDKLSDSRKSQVTDASIGTLQWDRAARVVAQIPTGTSQAASKKDVGKNALMNIALTRHIIPNANSQYDHLTKLRVAKAYAGAWGAVPMMYDYRIDDEYVGPDSWIINIRDFFPEPNKLTINDCNWVMISTTSTVGYLEDKLKKEGWDKANIRKIIDEAKEGKKPSKKDDPNRTGKDSSLLKTDTASKGKHAEIELITKFERGKKGRWVTFAPDYENLVIRDIKNPHKNGKIPVVLLQNFPRIDSIIGLSDIERGSTLQKAKDSLINLYLDGVKMSIFKPLKINPTGVKMSSIRNSAGSKWLMDDTSKVQEHNVSPQGINSFVGTYQFLDSALLNLNGTTNTTVASDQGSVTQGKTPAAIKSQQARENARDNWDRFMMEKFIEELYEGFINLMCEKQEKPVPIDLFETEIDQLIAAGMDDVAEVYESGKAGKLILKKSDIKSKYRYLIDAGSTMAKDDSEELEALMQSFNLFSQVPAEILASGGRQWDVSEHLKKILIKSGIQDWEKILPEVGTDEDPQQQIDPFATLDQNDAAVNQLIEQTLGGVNVQ